MVSRRRAVLVSFCAGGVVRELADGHSIGQVIRISPIFRSPVSSFSLVLGLWSVVCRCQRTGHSSYEVYRLQHASLHSYDTTRDTRFEFVFSDVVCCRHEISSLRACTWTLSVTGHTQLDRTGQKQSTVETSHRNQGSGRDRQY